MIAQNVTEKTRQRFERERRAEPRRRTTQKDMNANETAEQPTPLALAVRDGLGALPENWTENDPRMWREQCRVGDVAFQHLFVTTRGMSVPDWVTEGLPRMYQLLGEHARYREALQRIATSHNGDPLAEDMSLRAHKALCPDCKCGRCAPNT